ncbi:MAG: hypothetical protein J0L82_00820 [Deltaproteobacteria bacterium]|nr:hypothetical protein [Deltaproteobacteria bacterium]
MHETAHLLGLDERDAEYLQKYYVSSYVVEAAIQSPAVTRMKVLEALKKRVFGEERIQSLLEGVQNTKSFLAAAGVQCTGPSGEPRDFGAMIEVMANDDTKRSLGLPAVPSREFDEEDSLKEIRIWNLIRPDFPDFDSISGAVGGFMDDYPRVDLKALEVQKLKIAQVVEEIGTKWRGVRPLDAKGNPIIWNLTVCQDAALKEQIDAYRLIRDELESRVRQILRYD